MEEAVPPLSDFRHTVFTGFHPPEVPAPSYKGAELPEFACAGNFTQLFLVRGVYRVPSLAKSLRLGLVNLLIHSQGNNITFPRRKLYVGEY
jgi:hypothetical protein